MTDGYDTTWDVVKRDIRRFVRRVRLDVVNAGMGCFARANRRTVCDECGDEGFCFHLVWSERHFYRRRRLYCHDCYQETGWPEVKREDFGVATPRPSKVFGDLAPAGCRR